MKYTFLFDGLGRIFLVRDVLSLLNHDGMLYIHIEEERIVLNNNPENAYAKTSVDAASRILLPKEIREYKLLLKEGDYLDTVIENGSIIIPLCEAQRKAKIRYVRYTGDGGCVIVPRYIRNYLELSEGSGVELVKAENGFWMSKSDDKNACVIDNLGELIIPGEIARCCKVEFEPYDNRVLIKPYIA